MNEETIFTLVTGANRGMGFEISKELAQHGQHVILGARNQLKGKLAADELKDAGLDVDVVELDVTSHESISTAVKTIAQKYGRLDILVNNAGAAFDHHQAPSVLSLENIRKDFDINYFGLVDNTQQFLPLLKQSKSAKILNMSSMMGSKTAALDPHSIVYRATAVGYQSAKAAANMFTVQLAKEMQNAHWPITVNTVDPGMVATSFGGGDPEKVKKMGAKAVSEGVARLIELALAPENNVTATFSNVDGPVGW
ncbi:SDR family oxidoreductase [Secundilactobacillus folii]|uniref:SDR family NAD(P)-dependent oxidoreductase n=1 Tax=Secundilactobacillus folii TaxID=2678357 RepID=A0A7X2XUH9_9LACO|nr:SDR family oxidoreductase [Secundilactobacillus folii]MTV81325.1 SDR family NAD(P)-dependent oxidoreductase [Secundilactobacillus folii]